MEKKNLVAEIKQLNERGEGTARIATLNTRDRDGDVLQPGCCGEQTVPLLVAHQWDRVPVGKARVYEGPGAMLADFKINMDLGRGKELHSALRFDLDNPPPRAEWSFGFRVPEGGAERGMFQGQPVRFLKRFEVLEISPVVAGAGIATATLALKGDALDQAALAASIGATLERCTQLRAKLLAADFQRITDREREARERPHGYVFLPKGASPKIAQVATRFAGWATEDNRMTAPEIGLFRAARAGESPDFRMACKVIGVCFRDGSVAVDASLSPEKLAETVAHETAHANGADEREAEAFARKFMATTYRQMTGGSAPRPPGMTWDAAIAHARALRQLGIY